MGFGGIQGRMVPVSLHNHLYGYIMPHACPYSSSVKIPVFFSGVFKANYAYQISTVISILKIP
jgi:hypothetical protein